MTFIQISKDFCRTMVISIAKLVVCFCFYTSFCFKCSLSYQVTQRNSKYNSERNLNQFSSDKYQVKYPNFVKVMARIDNMNDVGKTKTNVHKIRHKWNKHFSTSTTTTTTTTTTEDDLFELYGDLNEEDYFESYEDQEDQDDDIDYDDENFSDEDTFSDTFEDIQADPTETPEIRVNSVDRPMSRFSEYKWQHFGTMAKVEESRNQQLNKRPSSEQLKIRAALDHFARVNGQSKCLKPSPKVIPVQQEHPDPSKTYTPHCTVLHRCAEDTGCCKRDTKCQFKSRELVHLYFYTSLIGKSETKVEKLTFYNHTECECKVRTESMPVENATEKPANGDTSPVNEERCKCPKRFSKRITHKCTCDCEEENEDCLQLKKGKEHFSILDRMCIQEEDCTFPTCEYGSYVVTEGKCPSKKEKFDEYRHIIIT